MPAHVRLHPFERRDIAAALTSTAALLLIIGSMLVLPDERPSLAFCSSALAGAALGFTGLFGLWLDRANRRVALWLFAASGALLVVAAPFVAVAAGRRVAAFILPAALFAVSALLLEPSAFRRAGPR